MMREAYTGCAKRILLQLLLATALFSPVFAQPRAYVSNETSNDVSVVDTATQKVLTSIKVGENPRGVVFSPDGKRAYVSNERSGSVLVIDTTSNAVVATIQMGERPVGEAMLPDGKKVYV